MFGDRLFVGTEIDEFIFLAPNSDQARDFLFGGGGADTFLLTDPTFSPRKIPDYICDFETGEDLIDVSVIDARPDKAGDQAFRFIKKQKFHDKPGELRFKNEALRGDIDGDGQADFKVKVVGFDKLLADDFVL